MGHFFNNKEDDSNNIKEEKKDIKSKLYEQSNFMNKLDFNVEYLNKYIVKMINSFLQARYTHNIEVCNKYLSKHCKELLQNDIKKDTQYSKFNNVNINIKNISIIQQNIQSVNYISDLIIEVKVNVEYERENIYTNAIRYIIEEYSQKLWFIFADKGWILEKYYERNFSIYNDDRIISI